MKLQEFKQQGKRKNNEDFHGCNENVVLVCDGIGGHVSGEIASNFIVEKVLSLFAERNEEISKTYIQEKLTEAQNDLNKILIEQPELEKMGTTFTGVFITEHAWYAAHIGDSRIYLFRPAEKKLWHTWDHSLVGELMRTKEITREAGRFHPMSNRISRAITANSQNATAKADIAKFDDLKKGDILFLCTDGVVEAWGDHELCELMFDTNISLEQKCKIISEKCNELSKDNNTAYFIEIEKNDEISAGKNIELTWISVDEIIADYELHIKNTSEPEVDIEIPTVNAQHNNAIIELPAQPLGENKKKRKTTSKKKRKLISLLLIFAFISLIAFAVWQMLKPETPNSKPEISKPETNKPETWKPSAKPIELPVERKAWQNAKKTDKVEAYETYLTAYPNGQYKEEATKRISELKDEEAWKKAKAEDSIAAYEAYRKSYKDGKYYEQAQIKIDELDNKLFNEAKSKKTKEAYEKYLKICPNGLHAEEAKKAIDAFNKLPDLPGTSDNTDADKPEDSTN